MSPICILGPAESNFNLKDFPRAGMYSRLHRFQRWPINLCKYLAFLVTVSKVLEVSAPHLVVSGSGNIRLLLIKRDDVEGSYRFSGYTKVNSLEFRMHSTSVRSVRNSSYARRAFPGIFLQQRYEPWGFLKINLPLNFPFQKKRHDLRFIWAAAVLNVFTLSDMISSGIPWGLQIFEDIELTPGL